MDDVSSQTEKYVAFANAVRTGLSKQGQKELPYSYLYDGLGSALFEAITLLPEYGVTRAEGRLLRRHAAEIANSLPEIRTVVELGSGSASKTRLLLQSLIGSEPLHYFPIDVSTDALTASQRELADLASIRVFPLPFEYLEGLTHPSLTENRVGKTLVLFLGSTLGNFHRLEALAFLRSIRDTISFGDAFLVGVDLDKPESVLLPAYDDPTGVTAAFNLNLLGHVNRVLGADFNLRQFSHEARFEYEERRIEMHLRSKIDQVINIPVADLRVELRTGETLWTESRSVSE